MTTTRPKVPRKRNVDRTVVNLVLNTCTFITFLLATQPNGTGIPLHEWGSVGLSFAVAAHLILHREWIIGITRRWRGPLPRETRQHYVLNVVFFFDMLLAVISGLLISRSVLPALGLQSLGTAGPWRQLHSATSNGALLILAVHIYMHRNWIVVTYRRYVWERINPRAKTGD